MNLAVVQNVAYFETKANVISKVQEVVTLASTRPFNVASGTGP